MNGSEFEKYQVHLKETIEKYIDILELLFSEYNDCSMFPTYRSWKVFKKISTDLETPLRSLKSNDMTDDYTETIKIAQRNQIQKVLEQVQPDNAVKASREQMPGFFEGTFEDLLFDYDRSKNDQHDFIFSKMFNEKKQSGYFNKHLNKLRNLGLTNEVDYLADTQNSHYDFNEDKKDTLRTEEIRNYISTKSNLKKILTEGAKNT